MPVTMQDVRAALDPEEPDYPSAAARLGQDAMPHLRTLVNGPDPMLASKAAYLAGLIQGPGSADVLADAARRSEPAIRVAAAAAARNLPPHAASQVLVPLAQDADAGVRRMVLKSAGPNVSPDLRSAIERLSQSETDPDVRALARQALDQGQGGGPR